MHGDGSDGRITPGQLARVKDVGKLRLAVADEGVAVAEFRLHALKVNAAFHSVCVSHGRQVHDTYVRARLLCRAEEQWKEEFGQERWTHVVRPEVQLVSLFGQSRRQTHNAGIVDKDVKAIGRGSDGLGSLLHRLEGGEVEFEELHDCGWRDLLNVFDCIVELCFGSRREENALG